MSDNQGTGSGMLGSESYEPPHLVPIGNLFNLLAGTEVTGCDVMSGSDTTGPDPVGCNG